MHILLYNISLFSLTYAHTLSSLSFFAQFGAVGTNGILGNEHDFSMSVRL